MVTPEQVIADALAGRGVSGNLLVSAAPDIATALRAAGLLPGPDEIVVSREVIERAVEVSRDGGYIRLARELRAALSQPAQEQQT